MQAHLALSVTGMMNRIWVEALKLIRREQNASLVAFYLSKEVLLLIIVSRCHISCRKKHIFLFKTVALLHRIEHRLQCYRQSLVCPLSKRFQIKIRETIITTLIQLGVTLLIGDRSSSKHRWLRVHRQLAEWISLYDSCYPYCIQLHIKMIQAWKNNTLHTAMPCFSEVRFIPLCFYRRPIFAPILLNERNSKRVFIFTKKKAEVSLRVCSGVSHYRGSEHEQ